jgi:hypothetical protein
MSNAAIETGRTKAAVETIRGGFSKKQRVC